MTETIEILLEKLPDYITDEDFDCPFYISKDSGVYTVGYSAHSDVNLSEMSGLDLREVLIELLEKLQNRK